MTESPESATETQWTVAGLAMTVGVGHLTSDSPANCLVSW